MGYGKPRLLDQVRCGISVVGKLSWSVPLITCIDLLRLAFEWIAARRIGRVRVAIVAAPWALTM